VTLVLAGIVVVAEITVAIFDTGGDIVEQLSLDTAAHEPAVIVIPVADRDAIDVPSQARTGVGIVT
jgi:hypothetical protein